MSTVPVLSARGVRKSFGGLAAVDGVDFDLYEGELRGLVGPNGSGKSTLVNLLSGHYTVDSGEISVSGARIDRLNAHRICELGVARTYQIPRPFGTLDVLANVKVACYFGRAEHRPSDVEKEAAHWVDFVGLTDVAHAPVDSITLLQRKLLELARALACRPRVIFLDEVLTGLNPRELEAGIALVRRIQGLGISIVIIEHIMRVILDLCDHLTVLNFGKVIAAGEPRACLQDSQVIEAYLGGSAHA